VADPLFYIACPLGDRTGGPEALALLNAEIRKRGFEAFLIPMHNFRGRSPHPEYDEYDYRVASGMPKSDDAHLILTEVSPIESFREIQRTADERIWMLWLSVNHSPIPRARYFTADSNCCAFFPTGTQSTQLPHDWWPYDTAPIEHGPARTLREAARRHHQSPFRRVKSVSVEAASIAYAERVVRRNINFGTQSFYGQGFIRSQLGRESFMLTDYPRLPKVKQQRKDPTLVVYNGAKGKWKIPDLQRRLPEVNFQPIQDLTYQEVCELLSRAVLYVEIGHLPGRDRLPREAANYGTPTVLLARGAGYCWEDFPLGVKYRIPYTVNWADRMAPIIQEVLDDPAEILATQAQFREWVAGEPDRYAAGLDAWLEGIVRAG